jgi:hypothetical protein
MGNFGRIDQDKLRDLANKAGISDAELDQALSDLNLFGVSFCAE